MRRLSGEEDDDEHLLPQADDDDELLTVDEPPAEPSSKARDSMMMKLYVSHTLNCWGDRMWTFAVSLFFIEIWPDYLLVAIYGLSIDVFCTLLGAHAGLQLAHLFLSTATNRFSSPGHFVDVMPRMPAVRQTLVAQNAMICACVAGLIAIIARGPDTHDWLYWIIVSLSIFFGSLSEVANMAQTIAVEKDWVLVICGSDSQRLSKTNAMLRRIDLSCNILAPIVCHAGRCIASLPNTPRLSAWSWPM